MSDDALGLQCPACGAAAEWPDCESCGHDFASVEVTAPAVDLDMAERFLSILDAEAEVFHFRTFPDAGRGPGRNYSGAWPEVSARLARDNAEGRGVFVVVNDGGHKSKEITRVRAVFADFDGTPLPDSFDLEPHCIVQSSERGFHAYWLIDGLELDQFTLMQVRIAARYGSDPAIKDLPRVMRLPGFLHQKPADEKHDGAPFQSRIIHESGGLPYAAERIREAFQSQAAPMAAQGAGNALQAHPERANAQGAVVGTERHGDLLILSGKLARQVHFSGLAQASALAALHAEAERGRWTRDMRPGEIEEAFSGALDKLRSGQWGTGKGAEVEVVEVPPEPAFTVPSLAGFMSAELSPPRYALSPLIPCGHVTLLGAHGGAGKSVLALTIAAHVACSQGWAGLDVTAAPCLFVSLEDPASLLFNRLRRIVDAYSLDARAVADNLRILDGTDGDSALMREVNVFGARALIETPAMEELARIAVKVSLIVIDNASDAFDGNENERRMVRAFVRRLAKMGREAGAGVLLLAHIDKTAARYGGAGNSYSGSTAWHNSARSRLALIADGSCVELRQEKHNLGPIHPPLSLRWSEHGILMPSGDVATNAGGAELIAQADADALLLAIQAAHAAGTQVSDARTGPATAQSVLSTFSELPQMLREKKGRARFWAALDRLRKAGDIEIVELWSPSRHLRRCIVPAELSPVSDRAQIPHTPYAGTGEPGEAGTPFAVNRQLSGTRETRETRETRKRKNCARCAGEGCDWCHEKAAA